MWDLNSCDNLKFFKNIPSTKEVPKSWTYSKLSLFVDGNPQYYSNCINVPNVCVYVSDILSFHLIYFLCGPCKFWCDTLKDAMNLQISCPKMTTEALSFLQQSVHNLR